MKTKKETPQKTDEIKEGWDYAFDFHVQMGYVVIEEDEQAIALAQLVNTYKKQGQIKALKKLKSKLIKFENERDVYDYIEKELKDLE